MRNMKLTFATLGLAMTALTFAADYEVRFQPATQLAEVKISIPAAEVMTFEMPAWIPGDYEIFNYGQTVRSVEFRNGGNRVEGKQESVNRWKSSGEANQVVYVVGASRGNFSDNLGFRGSAQFICGGAYGWIGGHDEEETKVQFYPATGEQIFSSLESVSGSLFKTQSYDRLIDSPTVVGKEVVSVGDAIRIVGYGAVAGVDLNGFQAIGEKVAAESKKMLPGEFSKQYTFFLSFGGNGGGLEHQDSSVITVYSKSPASSTSIMFHEFFHAYNVKRIRPEAIWDFDYSVAPKIDSLWWLEGVTDYYADVLAVRAGLKPRASFLTELGQNSAREKNRTATTRTSALVSSREVFGVQGSQGAGGVSYYAKGWLVGAALDLSIRQNSNGKHSLDDVMRGLWAIYQTGQGYPEPKIRELCTKFGGEKSGVVYDQSVEVAQAVPIADLLAGMGLKFVGNAIQDDSETGATKAGLAVNYPYAIGSESQ